MADVGLVRRRTDGAFCYSAGHGVDNGEKNGRNKERKKARKKTGV